MQLITYPSACPEILVGSNLDKSQPMSCILCYLKKNIYSESKTSRRVAITCIILYKLSQMLLEIIHVLFFQYAIIKFLAIDFSVFLKSDIISYFGILQFTQKCRAKEMRLYKKQPQNSHQDIWQIETVWNGH